jgi:orotate phosphoribosyltransferase
MQDQVIELLSGRRGHFLFESGHHGDLWLDLESLCLRPRQVQTLATELASALSGLAVDTICGPLVEGSFVALMVALELDVQFTYSERYTRRGSSGLFPAGYRVPDSLRGGLRGKRVAIVDDVINAGSAIRGTFTDLEECGATVAAIGTLLVLGTDAATFAASKGIPLHSVAQSSNDLWEPSGCPLCASGVPLEDVASFATILSM